MLKDINLQAADAELTQLTTVGHLAFFVADDGLHGDALWKSDGTSTGTVLVKDNSVDPDDLEVLIENPAGWCA